MAVANFLRIAPKTIWHGNINKWIRSSKLIYMIKYVSLALGCMTLGNWCYGQDEMLTLHQPEIEEQIQFAPRPQDVIASDNERIYKFNWAVDAPVTAVGSLWSGYAFTKIYSKDPVPDSIVAALNKDDINGFDRWGAGMNDDKVDDVSDYLFYGVMPLPALLFIDKKMRKDAGKIGFLYLESFAITGMLYTGATYFVDRYRPETYDNSIPVSERTGGGHKNSFFAGHVAVVATSTFFMAKVYNDYHPESKFKYVMWGGAAAATGVMIYMRHAAGKHFPTDLLLGTAVGTLSGILVPHFHKVKDGKGTAWNLGPSINPYGSGGAGLSFTYRFK